MNIILPPPSIALLFLRFLIQFTLGTTTTPPHLTGGDISINCGSTHASAPPLDLNGREWIPDSSPLLQLGGSSTASTLLHNHNHLISPSLPYAAARISPSQFSYSIPLNPGQKILRLHFHPFSYKGFKGFVDLFTVEVGHFTLLGNFSASLAAHALGMKYIVKEFCLYLHQHEQLNIIFSPSTYNPLLNTYAFVNGIEIISLPSSLSFFHGGPIGVQVVGQNSKVYVDYDTALELVHQLNVRQNSNPSNRDLDHMFSTWVTQKAHEEVCNSTWKVPVDVGFRYLIRLHFSKLGLKLMESDDLMFEVIIDEMIAHTNVDIGKGRDKNSIPRHVDYMALVTASKKHNKRNLVITLHSYDSLIDIDGNGLLVGFEVFKLSNRDGSLATPNSSPLPHQAKPSWIIKMLLYLIIGNRYAAVNVLIIILSLVNVIGHKSSVFWESSTDTEENKLSDKAQRLCRRFSLSEIQLATRNFSDGLLIGRGGFGKVYKGAIDHGNTTVAIKRLKLYSSQGAREFLTEIETLSKLRHNNLVSLIGYCNGHGEMILVYDYMPGGTLANHLYKPLQENNSSFLTWKQRLNICIGAARGLDYLHTGNGVIHRDVKASNILLDEKLVAKVSDFGLAKHEDRSKLESHVSTRVKGTRGYCDPHYINTCKLTRKSDTYAFGVVLLEALCGRPAVDLSLPEDEQILTHWARGNIKNGNIDQIVYASMRNEISEDSLRAFVVVAETCLHDEPKRRPTMTQVVLQLEAVLEQHDIKQALGLNAATNVSDDNKGKSIKMGLPKMHSVDLKNPNYPLRENNTRMDNVEASNRRKDGRKGTTQKPSWLQPWNYFWKRSKASRENELLYSEICEANLGVDQFDWETIVAATNKFSRKSKLGGGGGFGTVYKAILPNGLVVAVKRRSPYYQRRNKEFMNVIFLLPKLHHQNIIRVLGYCIHGEERVIIYEFMQNKSLDVHIGGQHLQWAVRLKIIMGIARGLVYLHQDYQRRVIHRDLKPRNILLDSGMNPKISGFGILRTLGEHEYELLTNSVAGTPGYLCPEYLSTGQCSVKSDVHSFGVVVLEIIAGRRNFHLSSSGENTEYLVDTAWRLWTEGRAIELIDVSVVGTFPEEEALRCIQVALLCIQQHSYDRPTMPCVLKMLEGVEPLLIPQAPRLLLDGPARNCSYDTDATVDSLPR